MAQLPADVSPGDGSHDDHHDALHALYNHLDTVGGGDVTAAWTAAEKSKLAAIEDGADVTDTTNVTAAGALMDSEVDADIKTLSLPASTTISTFGASLIDDADAATARSTLGVTVPTVLDEDNMATNSATAVPSQQSVKAYVDAEVAGSGGSGTTRNAYTHSVAGALSVTRAAADQATVVTISANATSFTDNLTTETDVLWLILKGNGSNDYTVDLSNILDRNDLVSSGGSGNPLTAALNIFSNTIAEVVIRKIGSSMYGELNVPVVGTAGATVPGVIDTATATPGDTALNVAWDEPFTGGTAITQYQVQHSTDDATWTTTADLGTGLTHQITGLTNSTLYYVQVRAKNAQGYGDWSTSVTATPGVAPIAFADSVSGGGGSQTGGNLTATLPTNSSGDLLLLLIDSATDTGSIATPAGWTEVVKISPASGVFFETALYAKESTGSEGATVNVAQTGYTVGFSYVTAAIENANVTSLAFDNAIIDGGFTTAVNFPALTTSNNDLVLRCGATDNSAFTPPAGVTTRENYVTNGNGIVMATDNDASVGAVAGSTSGGGFHKTMTIAIPEA